MWNGTERLRNDAFPTVTITYSNVQGGHTGHGNINTDPMFMNVAAGDMILEPLSCRVCQVHGLSAEMNPGQAVLAFQVLNHVPVVCRVADLWDTEEDESVATHP